jgi:AraC-like DNA-binding protein
MSGGMISVFGDADDYQDALRDECDIDLLVKDHRSPFRAQLTRISLSRMHLVAAEENAARIAFLSLPTRLVRVSLPMEGCTSLLFNGTAHCVTDLFIHGPGQHLYERTDGPSRWRSIWLTEQDLAGYILSITGGTFAIPQGTGRWRPPPVALRSLIRLYAAAVRVNKRNPEVIAGAKAAEGLEQQLALALTECLQTTMIDVPKSRCAAIMSRFETVARAHPNRAASMGEICASIGVSPATLQPCCQLHLGMRPLQYLRLLRLSLARRALRDADPRIALVSEIARQHGFGNAGRFAAEYQTLFGEPPSVTLEHEAPDRFVHVAPAR